MGDLRSMGGINLCDVLGDVAREGRISDGDRILAPVSLARFKRPCQLPFPRNNIRSRI